MRRSTITTAAMTSVLFLALMGSSQAQQASAAGDISVRQPDNVLVGRAMWDIERSRYAEARNLLDTLIQSYPNSDFVPRAKLSIGDAWYAEGRLAQAKAEYQDFVIFFPHRPEVADTQLKIDTIQRRSK